MMKYIRKIVFYSTEKHNAKNVVHFEIYMYFMKLNFYFN